MGKNRVFRAAALGGLVSVVIAACATSPDVDFGGAAGMGTGSTTTKTQTEAGPSGTIGSQCKSAGDCVEGICAPIGNASYCTQACPPVCPTGSYCSIINGAALCVPDLDQQCLKCAGTSDCKLPSDMCLKAPLGDSFCARDCTVDGLCPNGFTCIDGAAYQGAGDAGAPDAGAVTEDAGSDAGTDAGADAGNGGLPPSAPAKWCVPNGGTSCPCNSKRDGVIHACSVTNQHGTCGGAEVCEGDTSTWKGCSAATPDTESCNGKDDDCNGMTDEGDPNVLCIGVGPQPPNATWACMAGTCSLGACNLGWTAYPPGPVSAGCACALEMGEPNGVCAMATNAGTVTDTGAPITISGTLSSAADVDFWTFDSVDTDEVTTNSYHVAIKFDAPMPNDEFLMDVMRGDPCTNTPAGAGTAITSYDWCVNGTDGFPQPTGELTCGPSAAAHCGGTPTDPTSTSHSAKYYVRVYRKPGVTGTCTQYQLSVSGGGGECDVSKKCP